MNGEWLLNTYIIRSNPEEIINDNEVKSLIEKHLRLLEEECLSDEFDYYKTGFSFLHYGNRGVDLTIWHVGRWGNTFETYVCSWYCYGRDIWNMEQLDSAEPMLCQYEMNFLIEEISDLTKLVDCYALDDVRTQYIKASGNRKDNQSSLGFAKVF